jgi:hypothetical protein
MQLFVYYYNTLLVGSAPDSAPVGFFSPTAHTTHAVFKRGAGVSVLPVATAGVSRLQPS